MRFAYADPPYPGQSARWYRDHPDYAGEVDHAELVARLCRDYPDGWALSTSAVALQQVLALCPPVQVAIWHVTSAENPRGGHDRIWRCWEPVILYGGRREGPVVRNLIACGNMVGSYARVDNKQLPGQKPPFFSRWVFALLGAVPGDEVDDIFPGSGAVSRAWLDYCSQPSLWQEMTQQRRETPVRRQQRLARTGQETLKTELTP